jgi:hypothetical protein
LLSGQLPQITRINTDEYKQPKISQIYTDKDLGLLAFVLMAATVRAVHYKCPDKSGQLFISIPQPLGRYNSWELSHKNY